MRGFGGFEIEFDSPLVKITTFVKNLKSMKIFILSLIVAFGEMVFGQSDETDSLINLLPNATEAEKVKIFNELTIALTYSDPERAIYYGKQADSIANILSCTEHF